MAETFFDQADGLTKRSFFQTQNNEKAAGLFVKAGHLYKMAGNLTHAGESYLRASECFEKLGEKYDTTKHLLNASHCFEMVNNLQFTTDAILKVIKYCEKDGAFTQAAIQYEKLSEIEPDLQQKIRYLQRAIGYHTYETGQYTTSRCIKRLAQLQEENELYHEAIESYETIINMMTDDLAKFMVSNYIYHSLLCYLALGDNITTKQALEKYILTNPSFEKSRECNFVREICESIDWGNQRSPHTPQTPKSPFPLSRQREGNPDRFTQIVQDYDSIRSLTPIEIKILLKVKENIEEPSLI